MGEEISPASRSDADSTTRRRILTLMGAGGAVGLATLVSSPEAKAGHNATNTMHLGEANNAPTGSVTQIIADVDGPTLVLSNDEGNSLQCDRAVNVSVFDRDPIALFIDITRPGGGGIEAGARAGGIAIEGAAFPTEEELEFEDQKAGYGVRGIAMSAEGGFGPGVGVHGQSGSGTGVLGIADSGTAVEARSGVEGNGTGIALLVRGKSVFSTAGSASVPAGQNSVFVAAAHVTGDSHISVTLVGDPGMRTVRWVERTAGSGFRVHLTSTGPKPETPLTYFVVEPG